MPRIMSKSDKKTRRYANWTGSFEAKGVSQSVSHRVAADEGSIVRQGVQQQALQLRGHQSCRTVEIRLPVGDAVARHQLARVRLVIVGVYLTQPSVGGTKVFRRMSRH